MDTGVSFIMVGEVATVLPLLFRITQLSSSGCRSPFTVTVKQPELLLLLPLSDFPAAAAFGRFAGAGAGGAFTLNVWVPELVIGASFVESTIVSPPIFTEYLPLPYLQHLDSQVCIDICIESQNN